MKKVNRWLAIVLSIALVSTSVLYQFSSSMSANELSIPEDQTVQQEEPDQQDGDVVIDVPVDNQDAGEKPADSEEPAEVAMPAQTFKATAGNGIAVSVSAPEGALPEGTEMKVASVGSKRAASLLENDVDNIVDAQGVDITFYKDGEEIQPAAPIDVKLSNADVDGEDFEIYHVSDNGSVDAVEGEVKSTGAEFAADQFSIYIVVGTGTGGEDEEKTITVTYNFYNTKGVKIGETDVVEYAESSKGSNSFPVEYTFSPREGKTASIITTGDLASDSGFTLTDGTKISGTVTPSGDQTNFEVNIQFAANETTYKVTALFEKTSYAEGENKYETRNDLFKEQTGNGYVGDVTEVDAPDVAGFDVKSVEQVELAENAEQNVVVIKYDRKSFHLSYNTMGGSYVKSKKGKYEQEMTVYTLVPGSNVLSCGKVEHTHTAVPSGDAGDRNNQEKTIGCYTSKWSWGSFSWSWELSCGKTEHTHDDSCYSQGPDVYTPAPTREGYTFAGWYLDADCTEKADETVTLTDNVTVYAKWIPDVVSYTIVFQKQNLDGTYSYISSKTASAEVGTEVTATNETTTFDNSKYYHVGKRTSATVKADGTTCVYVRYDLTAYTLTFDISNMKNARGKTAKMTVNGVDYYASGTKYTISCKLGEDISSKWPVASNFTGTSSNFYGWSTSGVSTTFVSKRFEVTTDMLPSSGTERTYTANFQNGTKVILHYMLQNAEDSKYTDAERYRQEAYSSSDNWSAKQIEGFTNTRKEDKTENGVTNWYFYYSRNQYQIDYKYKSEDIKSIKNIPFEKNIKSSTYNFTPDRPEGINEHFVFAGWYDNSECLGEAYTFDKMPASNLVLYAKWAPEEVTVDKDFGYKINVDDANNYKATINVTYGTVADLGTPTRPGYEFVGWFYNGGEHDGEEYDTSQPVTESSLNLIAHWEKSTRTTYTVKYVTEDGDEVAPEVPGAGTIGQKVKAEAVVPTGDYADYIVNASSQTIVLDENPENNVITFVYGSISSQTYSIEYTINGKVVKSEVNLKAGASKFKVSADKTVLDEHKGYMFEDGKTSAWITIKPGEKNVVEFKLVPVKYTIEYRNAGDSYTSIEGVKTEYYVTDADYKLPDPVMEGYEFIGWDNTNNVATDGAHVHQPAHSITETTVCNGSYANLVFTACWAKLEVSGYEGTYDGQKHSVTAAVTGAEGYTVMYSTDEGKTWSSTAPEATHVSESQTVQVKAVKDGYRDLKVKTAAITINPAPLTITTPSETKSYDGDPLTAKGSIKGFVNDETASFTTTGTQTIAGSSDNTYELKWDGSAIQSDYAVSATVGTLTVTEYAGEITVTTTGGEFTYDGKAHGATVKVTGLPKGYTLETATSNDKATHVAEGTVTANCDTLVIKNTKGEDVTANLNIKRVDGSIIIKPATLTVSTPDASKVYDGEPLTKAGTINGFVNGETATFATTGSQTEVDSSDNTYSITWDKTAVESDYTISESVGTLTVTENTDEIVVTTTGGEFTYDGKAHGATVSVSTLPKGYTLETAVSNDTATHVADGTVTADCDTLVIKNAQGVDVTSKLNIRYVDGSITINPATLTVTTPSASKVYDGTPLTAAGTITGFVNGEKATFKTTGSQTAVDSSKNTYSITWDGTATETDYTISESIGTLEVTEYAGEITVTTTGGTFTYDGQSHGATVSVSTLPKGYTLETATSDDTATHVADGTVPANCDTLVIKNAQREDVTSKLNIKYVDGSISITPATLTVVTPSATKVYDSDPLTAEGSISGFIGN
ncbi:MAG: InlB B-repeat-containing protein, partial [Eubacteriaceae bacterium]|nr:InlB B-repeat-containing protein [Eubacteriaceae bacterium]